MKVSNPLTIIAIFAGSAEAFATGALVALPPETQKLFVYFVMLFPTLIVASFFLVLIKKHHVLYAPSDFGNQDHFLQLNDISRTVAEVTEQKISEASARGDAINPKEISLQIAAATAKNIENDLSKALYNYMKERPTEAFTSRGLGHILGISANSVTLQLYYLESIGRVQKGKDGNTTIWQIKTPIPENQRDATSTPASQ